jgi:hypothetical protein
MKSIKITNVEHLHDYILRITFDDGKIQEVDFRSFLENAQHPEISKYLDLNLFKLLSLPREISFGMITILFFLFGIFIQTR